MMKHILFLLLASPVIDGCLVIILKGPPKCPCSSLALDAFNTYETIKGFPIFKNLSHHAIIPPKVTIDDCNIKMKCEEKDYNLIVFDTEDSTMFGANSADGLCDRNTQTWGVAGKSKNFKRMFGVCVAYNRRQVIVGPSGNCPCPFQIIDKQTNGKELLDPYGNYVSDLLYYPMTRPIITWGDESQPGCPTSFDCEKEDDERFFIFTNSYFILDNPNVYCIRTNNGYYDSPRWVLLNGTTSERTFPYFYFACANIPRFENIVSVWKPAIINLSAGNTYTTGPTTKQTKPTTQTLRRCSCYINMVERDVGPWLRVTNWKIRGDYSPDNCKTHIKCQDDSVSVVWFDGKNGKSYVGESIIGECNIDIGKWGVVRIGDQVRNNISRFEHACIEAVKSEIIKPVEPPKCECRYQALNVFNTFETIKDFPHFQNVSQHPIQSPVVKTIGDCNISMWCSDGDYSLVVFDKETVTLFGAKSADGYCDPNTQTWQIEDKTVGGVKTFNRLFGVCVAYNRKHATVAPSANCPCVYQYVDNSNSKELLDHFSISSSRLHELEKSYPKVTEYDEMTQCPISFYCDKKGYIPVLVSSSRISGINKNTTFSCIHSNNGYYDSRIWLYNKSDESIERTYPSLYFSCIDFFNVKLPTVKPPQAKECRCRNEMSENDVGLWLKLTNWNVKGDFSDDRCQATFSCRGEVAEMFENVAQVWMDGKSYLTDKIYGECDFETRTWTVVRAGGHVWNNISTLEHSCVEPNQDMI